MKPDAAKHNPDPAYLRELVARSGLSQRRAAVLVGVSGRMMRHYLSLTPESWHPAPYSVQYALEQLAK